jgi:tRNA(fMet)-specific endonuclease VapC
MSFLIDTDTCSAHLKQRGIVGNRFLQYTGGLHLSAITLSELYAWVLRANAPSARLQALREMLNDMTVLDVTAHVAEKYGELQAQFLDAVRPRPAWIW